MSAIPSMNSALSRQLAQKSGSDPNVPQPKRSGHKSPAALFSYHRDTIMNTFANTQPAEAYLQARHRDAQALTYEIQEARKGNKVDLGYCTIIDNRFVTIGLQIHEMKSWTEALAFILRKFW